MKRPPSRQPESTKELTGLIRQACLVARDSATNVQEFIENSSKMAFLAVKDCEKELDRIERTVDQTITSAITDVTEPEARELLACLKFITDLERIGDLSWSITKRLQTSASRVFADDKRDLGAMAETLRSMLDHIHEGFVDRETEPANWVLHHDSQIDDRCRSMFRRHFESTVRRPREYSTNLLLIAQAFERAGDHAKNLAEEVLHLVEGRSVRHELKRRKAEA
ncbi:MAG: phosphate transport system protein [Acidobacteriaceae bacterium]|jgi:phosphate transport system protein